MKSRNEIVAKIAKKSTGAREIRKPESWANLDSVPMAQNAWRSANFESCVEQGIYKFSAFACQKPALGARVGLAHASKT